MGKKYFLRINVSLLLLIIISSFSSCANEMNMFGWNNNEQINFSVSAPSWKGNDSIASNSAKSETRATPITDTSLGTDKTFGIIADVVNGSNYTTEIDQEVVSYNTTNKIWETLANHYWPGANKTINFYAYYPASITNGTITHAAGTTPILAYTIPADATTQVDIMTATANNVSGSTNSSTPLTFSHIFAAVQFSIGSIGMPTGTITGITLNNILYKGVYNFNGTWTPDATSKKSFSQTVSVPTDAGASITSGTLTFMMMPQTLGSDASITVTYSNGGTLTQSIAGTWTAGNIYAYNISKTIPITNFDYKGDIQAYTVPLTGIYKLEVWGAQGGGDNKLGGNGGYSFGNIKLLQNTNLFVCIGGNNGYNGADHLHTWGVTGGGATHIALTNRGVLKNYEQYKNEVLIVAGGGGGNNDGGSGGSGGGLSGDNGIDFTYTGYNIKGGSGGSQTAGGISTGRSSQDILVDGSFGEGGYAYTSDTSDYGAIGGSGWYGGGGTAFSGCSGGGSGHLGSNLISGTTGMSNGVRSGDGYAKITFVSAN